MLIGRRKLLVMAGSPVVAGAITLAPASAASIYDSGYEVGSG